MSTNLKQINIMKLTIINNEKAKQSTHKAYNESAWIRQVDSYLKYKDVVYYMDEYGDDVFVGYTIPEGIRLFSEITYSSSMSTAPFKRVDMMPISNYGIDIVTLYRQMTSGEITEEKFKEIGKSLMDEVIEQFEVSFGLFYDEQSDKNIPIPNTQEGRKIMAHKSGYGVMFSNQF